MSDISTKSASLDALSIANKTKKPDTRNNLGQDAFLELMITQLKNQDPTAPKDNGEFISQLAQFSSVSSLDKLNTNFSSFSNRLVSNQALQASSMVGRTVMAPGQQTLLEANGQITAQALLPPGSSNFTVTIYGPNGAPVKTIPIEKLNSDTLKFQWDGKQAAINGETLPTQPNDPTAKPGLYTVKINALVEGKNTQLGTQVSANVNSVTLGKDGSVTLNLAGAGAVKLSDIQEIL